MPPRNNSYEAKPEIKNEETPLMLTSPSQDSLEPHLYHQHKRRLSLGVILAFLVPSLIILGAVSVVLNHSSALKAEQKAARAQVTVTDKGEYKVEFDNTTISSDRTLADLAHRMLPPWYEASLMAIDDVLQPDTMEPSNVQKAREALLVTRTLLDIFSPVFPIPSLWKKVRKLYKEGYEAVGEFQDLDHSGVDYDSKLLGKRTRRVLSWKQDFVRFQSRRNVRRFLYHGMDANACARHESSHLMWDTLSNVPCGYDSATASLQQLGQVQLSNALQYWQTVQQYASVLKQDDQEDFHNLRKVLRLFLDEIDLFGDIMIPSVHSQKGHLATLDKAQSMLGNVNDHWTAYHIYKTQKSQPEKQSKLADQVDELWKEFLEWAQSNDFEGAMKTVFHTLTAKR